MCTDTPLQSIEDVVKLLLVSISRATIKQNRSASLN